MRPLDAHCHLGLGKLYAERPLQRNGSAFVRHRRGKRKRPRAVTPAVCRPTSWTSGRVRWTRLQMPSRRRHCPDPAESRRYTAGWIGLPGCGRREVLGRRVRAMGATGVGYRSRATGSGGDIGRRRGGRPTGRRLGAVTDPVAAAMTAAGVSCTSTAGASASTATTSALRQGRSYGQQQGQQAQQQRAKNHEHPPSLCTHPSRL